MAHFKLPCPLNIAASKAGMLCAAKGVDISFKGINYNPCAVVINPTAVSVGATGINLSPQAISVAPTGVNVNPFGASISPSLIVIAPYDTTVAGQVCFYLRSWIAQPNACLASYAWSILGTSFMIAILAVCGALFARPE